MNATDPKNSESSDNHSPSPKRNLRFSLRFLLLLLIGTGLVCIFVVWRRSRIETITFLEAKGFLVYSSSEAIPSPDWGAPKANGQGSFAESWKSWWRKPWLDCIRKVGDYEHYQHVKPSYGNSPLHAEEIRKVLTTLPSLTKVDTGSDDWWSDPEVRAHLFEHSSLRSLRTQCVAHPMESVAYGSLKSRLRELSISISRKESLPIFLEDLDRLPHLEKLRLDYVSGAPVSFDELGQLRSLVQLEIRNLQWPDLRGVGDFSQAVREPSASVNGWEELQSLQSLKLAQVFLSESDWARVLQLPSLTQLHLEGCGMPRRPDGSAIVVPDRAETIYQIIISNPVPWDRLHASPSLERMELSCWMLNPTFTSFINQSQIRSLVLASWSYPYRQISELPRILSSIDPQVKIVLPREYMPLHEPFWSTVIGEERERFEALTEFEAWASTRSNLTVGPVD
ncbi:hypothetical protein [Pirellula sp. SH-Sr6A]|uniref:hypothetical protein n=1 Tax=Pirellula sp. SH-Sr6A TaxID=1632865 RepID=UPI0011BAC882|nr:hypothetical protein [Pirellula sp. SH-Sr6A]